MYSFVVGHITAFSIAPAPVEILNNAHEHPEHHHCRVIDLAAGILFYFICAYAIMTNALFKMVFSFLFPSVYCSHMKLALVCHLELFLIITSWNRLTKLINSLSIPENKMVLKGSSYWSNSFLLWWWKPIVFALLFKWGHYFLAPFIIAEK